MHAIYFLLILVNIKNIFPKKKNHPEGEISIFENFFRSCHLKPIILLFE